ncbi:hypothetical protein BS78_08G063700 [Paspalum vaginatum]|nr:hypothetical protein BS78_08G063700 [Paspalum vaginatum]
MDRVESTSSEPRTRKRARDIKRKSKKKYKARPDDGDDVCAICDDGGYITCCDGGCLRSFHLTEEHGKGSKCPSLGISSEKAKVFQCKDNSCGHFYHPKCVSELLHPGSKLRASLLEQHVAAGLKFLCHVHKCSVCHGTENKDDKNMQFAVCVLCPTTYHRKCLPSNIPFEGKEGPNGYIFQRAWDGILRDRILIYCMKHEIVKELGIPSRKLIIFPDAKNICMPKGPESAPKEQDTLAEEELLDYPSSEPSLSLPSATVQNRFCSSNPMDSFAPLSLFTHPFPGSCGWLDD